MATNTTRNLGVRRYFSALSAYRNFETSGTVQYKVVRESMNFLGTVYNATQSLPFDAGTSPNQYTAKAIKQLQYAWDNQWIAPVS